MAGVRSRANGKISQCTHRPSWNATFAAVNGSFSRGSLRIFDLYSDTTAIAANHLKVESRIHSETSEIEIAILSDPLAPQRLFSQKR